MAKGETNYQDVNITSGKVKTLHDVLVKAQTAFEEAALEAVTKAGAIPKGHYGKIVRSRFGGGWQLATRATPWGAKGAGGSLDI